VPSRSPSGGKSHAKQLSDAWHIPRLHARSGARAGAWPTSFVSFLIAPCRLDLSGGEQDQIVSRGRRCGPFPAHPRDRSTADRGALWWRQCLTHQAAIAASMSSG
jgi:hypothetical protein